MPTNEEIEGANSDYRIEVAIKSTIDERWDKNCDWCQTALVPGKDIVVTWPNRRNGTIKDLRSIPLCAECFDALTAAITQDHEAHRLEGDLMHLAANFEMPLTVTVTIPSRHHEGPPRAILRFEDVLWEDIAEQVAQHLFVLAELFDEKDAALAKLRATRGAR